MTTRAAKIRARARRRYSEIERLRGDPRYTRVLGRFVGEGLLVGNVQVEPHREPIALADALWAGELEPRILELLPALIVKKPSIVRKPKALPEDLALAVRALKRGAVPGNFRGIPGKDLQRWLPRVGRRGKLPSLLKSFRLTAVDTKLLDRLKAELGSTETDVIRRALRELAGTLLVNDRRGKRP